MKMIAIATLMMLGALAIGGAAPALDVTGEAAAVQCDTYDLGDVKVNACDAVCAVGQRVLRAECIE